MTREEEIQKVAISFCDKTNPQLLVGDYSFIQGAKWADKHPKSPWISVNDDLPCNHEELMEPICQLDDRLIYETKQVFVRCSGNSISTAHMVNLHNRWRWYPDDIDVKHWFPIPELPKE